LYIIFGANIEDRDFNQQTPLMVTMYDKHMDCTSFSKCRTKCTRFQTIDPLTITTDSNFGEAILLLLTYGANIHAKNNEGFTAPMRASKYKYDHIIFN
jgi:hypothetical protein